MLYAALTPKDDDIKDWLIALEHENLQQSVILELRRPTLFAILTFIAGVQPGDKLLGTLSND